MDSEINAARPSSRNAETRTPTARVEILLALDHEIPLESRYRLAPHARVLLDERVGIEEISRASAVPVGHITQARALASASSDPLEGIQQRSRASGARIVPFSSPNYPPRLLELELPPPCLFVRGTAPLEVLRRPAIGVVGPRNADPYGLEATRHLAGDLSRAGLVIGSGFARGVDAAAHSEAAENGKPTVCWLGCGVDVPYPRQNQRLVEPILESGGLLVSEFDFGTSPAAWRFPLRNRLIAASTIGMLVTQASLRSGSLISARLALELGREVYAVPGRIFDARSRGTNLLLRDGAHVALNADSILDTLPLHVQEELQRLREVAGGAGGIEARLEQLFTSSARGWNPDELRDELGCGELGPLIAALSELELNGRIERGPGGDYRSAKEA